MHFKNLYFQSQQVPGYICTPNSSYSYSSLLACLPQLCGHLLLVCLCILLRVVQDDVLSMAGELEVEVHGADSKGGAVAAPCLDTVATRELHKNVLNVLKQRYVPKV